MFHDRGNVGNHAGRHYFHRDEGWRQHHDHARADGAGQRYSRGGFNGSSNNTEAEGITEPTTGGKVEYLTRAWHPRFFLKNAVLT